MLSVVIKTLLILYICDYVSSGELLISSVCDGTSDVCSITNLHSDEEISFTFDRNMSHSPENVIFKECNLKYIPQLFNILTKIKVFIMKKCGVKLVQQKDFEYARSVQVLILEDNSIEELTDKVFYSLIKINDIRLRNNYLFNLHSNTFFGLEKLKYLDLGFNKIRVIQNELFSNLISLEYIDLQFNNIEKIDSNVFEHNTKLQTILLNNNKIIVFESNSIKHIPQLNLLDLSFNVIDEIEVQSVDRLRLNNAGLKVLRIFGGVTELSANNNNLHGFMISNRNHITKLELHNNLIYAITDFNGMRNLAELDLSHNPLKDLDVSAMVDLPNLMKLNLSETHLENLTSDTFLVQEHLSEIDLTFIRLLAFDLALFTPMKSLRKLHISGNNFLTFKMKTLKDSLPHLETITLEMQSVSNADWNCSHYLDVVEHLKKSHPRINIKPQTHVDCKHKQKDYNQSTESTKVIAPNIRNDSACSNRVKYFNANTIDETLIASVVILTFVLVLIIFVLQVKNHFPSVIKPSFFRRSPAATRLQEESDL